LEACLVQITEKTRTTFGWLNATQALGALNDNLYKLLVIAYLIGVEGQMSAGRISATAGAIFTLPFLIFSAYAGKLADRFSKSRITVILKFTEIAIMLAGTAAFIFGSKFMLYLVMFLMTTHSAFFSPSKYGIIPELVEREYLARANGLVEATTYLAVIIAAVFVPILVWITRNNFAIASIICIAVAAAGTLTSLAIKKTAPVRSKGRSSIFFFVDITKTLAGIRNQRGLLPAILASAYFLLIGVSVQLLIIPYGMENLGLDQANSMYLFLPGAVGIAAGAFIAGRICGRAVELGLVTIGAIAVAFTSAGLGLIKGNLFNAFLLVFLLGASSGLIIVPLNTYIQLHSPVERRGRVIAAANFIGWFGSFLAALFVFLLSDTLKISATKIFLVLSVMTAIMAAACIVIMPALLLRAILVGLVKFCYRLKIIDVENIPAEGGLLLVSNHSAWSDALILMAAQNRHIRFIMDKGFFNVWFLKPFCKILGVIPISEKDNPKKLMHSLIDAKEAMNKGQAVCIFAEGAMTRTGRLQPFKKGLGMIIEDSSCKVIPVYIGGTWGSIFSHHRGKPLTKFPTKFLRRVCVYFGEPMPSTSTVEQIREKVSELSDKYSSQLTQPDNPKS
jgi:acyl-[acyl-carrier-protein]-phospholipid O-acyltransferase / long-chain-fatty-acid--[acyl-carrier-protein] ligase